MMTGGVGPRGVRPSYPPGAWRGERILVVGDLHGHFSELDLRFINASAADLVVFIGDLGSGSRKDGLRIVREIARLQKPTLILPGNNDAPHMAVLAAEVAHQKGRQALLAKLHDRAEPAPALVVGYSLLRLEVTGRFLTVVTGRPLSLGGAELSFPDVLGRTYGVRTLGDSEKKYEELVDASLDDELLVIAHNGPAGLGGEPSDPWGRDFQLNVDELPRDWGDPDLEHMLDYAERVGKKILGLVAGHMHRKDHGASRPFESTYAGRIPCWNCACVPRILGEEGREGHHFVELLWEGDRYTAREFWCNLS